MIRHFWDQLRDFTTLRRSPAHWLELEEGPLYAIGDVHGHLEKLRGLEALVLRDARELGTGDPPRVVYLGDYVDRGPDSAGTLDHLCAAAPLIRIFLRGNHDRMFAEFLDRPSKRAFWLDLGGYETLASYGLWPDALEGKSHHVKARLEASIPSAHRRFLDTLHDGAVTRTHRFVHAGIDPFRPVEEQGPDILENIREPFLSFDGVPLDGKRVVHGHSPSEHVEMHKPCRIGCDTGAGFGRPLSAVRIIAGEHSKILAKA